VKTIGLHFQSISQHPPYWFLRTSKKRLSLVPHFLLTRGRPELFHLQRLWNCWYQCLMLLAGGGSLWSCLRKARWTETTDSCFATCSTQNASDPDSLFSFYNVTDREVENGIVHAAPFHVGNTLLHAYPEPLSSLETAPIILVLAVLQYYCPLGLVRFFFCRWSVFEFYWKLKIHL
jgi:hypothetical protein